jgi:orotidine-5'-phosphate decarboxylase
MGLLTPASPADRVIAALDVDSKAEALALVESLEGAVGFHKVGWRLFLGEGMQFVRRLRAMGLRVFLDLKMDDIPETIETAVRAIADQADLLTLRGGAATVAAAARGRGASELPRLLHVPLLSSESAEDLAGLGRPVEGDPRGLIEGRVRRALDAGCDGFIGSGENIALLRALAGPERLIVAPGIRPAGSEAHDHLHVSTPGAAIRAGADYLVVGRPLRQGDDPAKAARAIIGEIEAALSTLSEP